MKTRVLVLVVILLSALQLSAAELQRIEWMDEKISDVVARLRKVREARRANIVAVDWENYAFLIPAAGSVQGGNGTFFKSDLSIANHRGVDQRISVLWFERGKNNGSASTQTFTVPANTTVMQRDFVTQILHKSGLGSILVVGIDANGNIDEEALLDGFSRIWTPQPNATGTVSEEFASVELEDTLATSYAYGLRQDAQFRTNVGFVNIWDTPNTYTVDIIGTSGNTTFTKDVQAYSMEQIAAPAGNWGDFYIRVRSADANFNWWTAYAASTDNITGDGWVSHVH